MMGSLIVLDFSTKLTDFSLLDKIRIGVMEETWVELDSSYTPKLIEEVDEF